MLFIAEEIIQFKDLGKRVAITAGASAPDHIVQEIINKINPKKIEYFVNTEEEEYFPLPIELRKVYKNTEVLLNRIFPKAQLNNSNRIFSNDREWTATDALIAL